MNQVKNAVKELRKGPAKPIHEIKIQIFMDNHIEVMGFPSNYNAAMDIMTAGLRRVANYFLSLAKEGLLDDKMNIKKNRIIQNQKPILGPDGRRLQ